MLNKQLNNIVEYSIKHNVSLVDDADIKRKFRKQFLVLCKICLLHHHLSKLIKLFNDTFGTILLFAFGTCFAVVVVSFFVLSGKLQSTEIDWSNVFCIMAINFPFVMDTIYICEVSHSTIEEAKKSGELIHKIETEDRDVVDEIEMFSLQIANQQVEFNAAGFFPINYTLVFSSCSNNNFLRSSVELPHILINRDRFKEILLKIIDFDIKLQTSCIIIDYGKHKKRHLIQILGRYCVLILLIITFLCLPCIYPQYNDMITTPNLVGFLIMFLHSSVSCQIIGLISMIKSRFAILNKQLNKLVEYSTKHVGLVDEEYDVKRKLRKQFLALCKICLLHHHLSKLIKLFNDTFGVILLSMVGGSFGTIVVTFFQISGELQATKIEWFYVFCMASGTMSFIIETIYVCEAKKSGELIHKIETEDHDMIDEIEMFSLQIANERVEFNAAGFFPVNYTLVFSIIAMEKQFEKFVNNFRILLLHGQIFGLVTFSYTRKKFVASKLRFVYNVLLAFGSGMLVGYYLYLATRQEKLTMNKTIYVIISVTCEVYQIIIWVYSVISCGKFQRILNEIIEFDTKLQKSCIMINYSKNKKRICLQLLGRYSLIIMEISDYVSYMFMYPDYDDLAGDIISILVTILNSSLNNLIENCTKSPLNLNGIDARRKLKKQLLSLCEICHLHHRLSKLIKLFNDTFGVILLFMFANSFVLSVVTFFIMVGQLQSTKIDWVYIVYMAIGTIPFVIDTIYVCHICYSTIGEANKSGELIHKIETENHDIIDEIEMFSLQIANERVEFSAAGFFPINYTLVFSYGQNRAVFQPSFRTGNFQLWRHKFRPSKLRYIYNAFLICGYCTMVSYSQFQWINVEMPPLVKMLRISFLGVFEIQMVATWGCSLTNGRNFIEFLLKIVDFDVKLQANRTIIDYNKNRKRIQFHFVGSCFLLTVIFFSYMFFTRSEDVHERFPEVAFNLLVLINSIICYQTTEFISMIRTRFGILNKQINKMVKSSLRNDINTIIEGVVDSKPQFLALSKICSLHHHLSKMVKLFNGTFGLILLFMFGTSFLVIVISFFYITAMSLATEFRLVAAIFTPVSCMSFVIDTVYVCDVCYSTVGESGELIHKIESEDRDIIDEIEMFSLQILNENVEFSAAGFFPINYTLITGGVTTYIIMLIQLTATLLG
ncbi:gustatory receptor Gr64 [Asbolus verrucosus]|uniref:Gustatory receptor Gr64 n=1 Tax=Asbolus verrucosus TaxID=1661398 RepID=A0A482V9D9_ASBVE|nr:gustatory receptor Gr64 [Asbolus verrucosus]